MCRRPTLRRWRRYQQVHIRQNSPPATLTRRRPALRGLPDVLTTSRVQDSRPSAPCPRTPSRAADAPLARHQLHGRTAIQRSVIHQIHFRTMTSLPVSATAPVRTQPSLVTAAVAAITEVMAMAAAVTEVATATEPAVTTAAIITMGPVNRRTTQSTRTNRQATVGSGCRMNRLIRIMENP